MTSLLSRLKIIPLVEEYTVYMWNKKLAKKNATISESRVKICVVRLGVNINRLRTAQPGLSCRSKEYG